MIAALVNVLNPALITASDKLSHRVAQGVIVIYIIFPVAILVVLVKYMRKPDGIEDKEYLEKFSALTDGLRTDSKLSLAFLFVFLFRRLILILLFIVNDRNT